MVVGSINSLETVSQPVAMTIQAAKEKKQKTKNGLSFYWRIQRFYTNFHVVWNQYKYILKRWSNARYSAVTYPCECLTVQPEKRKLPWMKFALLVIWEARKGQIVAPGFQPERLQPLSMISDGDAASFTSMMNSNYWCRSLPTSTELKSSPNNKNLPMVNKLEAIQTYCILINCIDWHRLSSIKKKKIIIGAVDRLKISQSEHL